MAGTATAWPTPLLSVVKRSVLGYCVRQKYAKVRAEFDELLSLRVWVFCDLIRAFLPGFGQMCLALSVLAGDLQCCARVSPRYMSKDSRFLAVMRCLFGCQVAAEQLMVCAFHGLALC